MLVMEARREAFSSGAHESLASLVSLANSSSFINVNTYKGLGVMMQVFRDNLIGFWLLFGLGSVNNNLEAFMKCVNFIALVLVLAGAINWGLWGFFQFDLVAWLASGNTSWAARFVYAIVGLAGVWSLGL